MKLELTSAYLFLQLVPVYEVLAKPVAQLQVPFRTPPYAASGLRSQLSFNTCSHSEQL